MTHFVSDRITVNPEQATRPADTDNDENRNADYAEDADFTD